MTTYSVVVKRIINDPMKYTGKHFSPYPPCTVSDCEWYTDKRIDRCEYHVNVVACDEYIPFRTTAIVKPYP